MFVPRRILKRINESEYVCVPKSRLWLWIDAIPVIWFGAFAVLMVAGIFGFMKPAPSVRVFMAVFLVPWALGQWWILRDFLLLEVAITRIALGRDYVLLNRSVLWRESESRLEADATEDIYMSGRSRAVLNVCVSQRGKVKVVERGLSEADAELLREVLSNSLAVESLQAGIKT